MSSWPTQLAVALATMLAGCVVVVSEHPLSGDADSELDERLIGWWEMVRAPGDDKQQERYALVVGRLEGRATALECVTLHLDANDRAVVERYPLHASRLGDARHLSVTAGDDTFVVYRYTIDKGGRLVLKALDTEAVAAAIESDEVAGRVKRAAADSAHAGVLREVRITAPTDELRAWLGDAGSTVWERKGPWEALQRLPRHLADER